MTERDYFNLKLEALSWLMSFRQNHPDFTFHFARDTRSLFQGSTNPANGKPYFYIEVAERSGIKGRYYFNFSFQLDDTLIRRAVVEVGWRDDRGNINQTFQSFAQNIGLVTNNRGSGRKFFDAPNHQGLKESFLSWLENNCQLIVDSFREVILSEGDFGSIWNEKRQSLIDGGIINQDPVEGRYQLTDGAFLNDNVAEGPIANNSVHEERRMNMQEEIKQLVESNLQVILTGAPGTGKTYTARKVALEITGEAEDTPEEESRIKVVQFHPGYDYSDFVIGMKPVLVTENGKEVFKDEQGRLYTINNNEADGQRQDFSGKVCVSYVWRDGVFKEFANRAKEAYDTSPADPQKFVFLIDEINRADLSRVFGELFSLFEEDYRYPTNRKGIILPNGEEFVIPKNLYIIGTMNDIDRSVESMDFALRRRFAWHEVSADKSERIIEDKIDDAETKRKLLSAMRKVNEMIADPNSRLGKEYQLGGAIFAKYLKYQGEDDSFDSLWNNHIAVILNEYLRGRRDKESKLVELRNAYDEGIQSQNGVGGSDVTSQD